MTEKIPDKITPATLTLILGGARSGKSAYAEEQAKTSGGSVLFVATATPSDDEMAARIQKHRAGRPPGWETLEAPLEVGQAILARRAAAQVLILDCVTLLVNNVLLPLPEDTGAEILMDRLSAELDALLDAHARLGGQWFVVSNEVGLGLVPPYPLGRVYRDALGWANQRLASAADRVVLMVAGLPMFVKG